MTTHSLTLTRTEAAQMIGVSEKTVDRLCARGDLRSAHIGGRVVLHRQGVIDYLDRLFKVANRQGVADAARVDPLVPELAELRSRRNAPQADRHLGRAA